MLVSLRLSGSDSQVVGLAYVGECSTSGRTQYVIPIPPLDKGPAVCRDVDTGRSPARLDELVEDTRNTGWQSDVKYPGNVVQTLEHLDTHSELTSPDRRRPTSEACLAATDSAVDRTCRCWIQLHDSSFLVTSP